MVGMRSARTGLVIGAVLLVTGLAKAWATAMATGELMIIGCGGESFAIPLGRSDWALAHCWGCYVAAAGAGLLALSALGRKARHIRA